MEHVKASITMEQAIGSGLLGGVLILSLVLAWGIRRITVNRFPEKISTLIAPVLFILIAAAGYVWSDALLSDRSLLLIGTYLGFGWLVLNTVRLMSESALPRYVIIFLVVPLILFEAMGLLDPFITFLRSLDFTFGSLTISVYSILQSLLALSVLLWIASLILARLEGSLRRVKKLRTADRAIVMKTSKILLWVVIFFLFLSILGVDVSSLAFLGGAIGVGVGFGLQKIASNFISGLILLFEKSIEVDDLIELSDGTYGFVRDLGARYIRVETFDGKEILIPNEDFITNRVVNWTYSTHRGRVEIPLEVEYDTDLKKARALMLEAAQEHPRCVTDPAPACFVRNFAPSGVTLTLYFWVEDVTLGRYEPQSDVMIAILEKFRNSGIQIPFPQMDVTLKTQPVLIKQK